jgi:hypothetical protein
MRQAIISGKTKSGLMAAATRVAPWDVQPSNFRSTISARARSIWWWQALEKGQQRGALIREFARWQAALRTGHDDLIFGDIGANIEYLDWGLHDVSPMVKIKVAGVDTPALACGQIGGQSR